MEDYNDTAAVAAEEAETASGEPNGSEKNTNENSLPVRKERSRSSSAAPFSG